MPDLASIVPIVEAVAKVAGGVGGAGGGGSIVLPPAPTPAPAPPTPTAAPTTPVVNPQDALDAQASTQRTLQRAVLGQQQPGATALGNSGNLNVKSLLGS